MMRFGLYVPTRGRPEQLARCIDSAFDTAEHPERVEFICYRDDDDDSYDGCDLRTRWVTGPRLTLSKCWNVCYAAGDADIVCHLGDDIVFRTEGWDTAVAEVFEAMPDRIGFVYTRDGVQDQALGTHGFLSRQWVEAVGYMCPPLFSHDYNDTWLNEVAHRIGRRIYLPNVLMEHMHWLWGKADHDQTYLDHEEFGRRDNVSELWCATEELRERDAARLRAVMT